MALSNKCATTTTTLCKETHTIKSTQTGDETQREIILFISCPKLEMIGINFDRVMLNWEVGWRDVSRFHHSHPSILYFYEATARIDDDQEEEEEVVVLDDVSLQLLSVAGRLIIVHPPRERKKIKIYLIFYRTDRLYRTRDGALVQCRSTNETSSGSVSTATGAAAAACPQETGEETKKGSKKENLVRLVSVFSHHLWGRHWQMKRLRPSVSFIARLLHGL